jgi:heme-degrading monooxygenase HmoA
VIARMWRGWERTEKAAEYVDIVERTGMAEYRLIPGNEGAQLLTRDFEDGRTEVITLSWWTDLDAIRGFAGETSRSPSITQRTTNTSSTGRPPLRTSTWRPRSSFLAGGDRAIAE